jgi:tRNA/tmRNA/rRNA uracil-C5-methylase (TrmA/RlmC/RlmD family)
MPKQNKNFPGSNNFPGSRRPPIQRDEAEDTPTGRRGRVRRGRFSAKSGQPGQSGNSGKGRDDRSASGPGGHGSRGKQGGRFGARRGAPLEAEDREINDSDLRFSDLLMQLAKREAPDLVQGHNHPEPLARLPYEQELELKNRAFQEFWTARGLPDKPNKVLPSPRPRGYRTTTKRRVVFLKGQYELTFMTESSSAANPRAGKESLVEPKEHKAIYAFLLAKLNTPAYANLASALNYLIIRGDYERFTVLFNVHRLNAEVVRKAKMMGDHLKALETKVVSAFMFYDPSKSEFYFEARNPEGPWKIKKIFGPDDIHLKVLQRTYAFHPTSFCQVNASILPLFLEKADQLLKPKPEYRLLDLYSGFGFFTLHLGPNYGEAFGVDLGLSSIESGQKMASADPAAHCRFKAGRIVVKTLDKLLPPATGDKPEALLLDPPRQGTEPGVIRALAARNPARVLHIFCDLDTLPKEVNQWRKSGFMVSKVVPLDMFPGTDNLEVMVLFIPDRYGILNRIDKSRASLSEAGQVDALMNADEGLDFSEDGDESAPRVAAKRKPQAFDRSRPETEKQRAEKFAKSRISKRGDAPAQSEAPSRLFRPGKDRFRPGADHGPKPAGRFGGNRGDKPAGRRGDRAMLPDDLPSGRPPRPGRSPGPGRTERRDRKPRGRKF